LSRRSIWKPKMTPQQPSMHRASRGTEQVGAQSTEQVGTSTEQVGTGTEQAGTCTEQAGTEQAGAEQAGTEQVGAEQAGAVLANPISRSPNTHLRAREQGVHHQVLRLSAYGAGM
jgi:hypothetical protein